VYLNIQLPPGMELDVSDDEFSSGFLQGPGEWQLGTIDSLQSSELTFVFLVSGEAGEKRVLGVEAGIRQEDGDTFVQRRLSHTITVAARELDVRQIVNGSSEPIVVKPGEVVKGEVHYRNVGTIGLREAIVEVSFEGVGFDPDSLVIETGAYNPRTQSIVWSTATEPNLAVIQPQEEGVLEYSFQVLDVDRFPTEGEGASNNVIVTTATVDSPDIPLPAGQPRRVVSDRAVMSVGTTLRLSAEAFYDDGRLGLNSEGPLPPQVGEETLYTVRFRIGSTLNTAANVHLTAVLPDGVNYTGEHYKTGGDITFNERTGRLDWTILQMPGSTGRSLPPQELHIQVAIVPGENQRGREVPLLNQLTLEAVDQFTEQREQEGLKTYPTTETAEPGEGIVE